MTSSTLFCCESELCCDFALFGLILMAFNLVNFKILLQKEERKRKKYDICVAPIVVWRSYFAHSCSQIHFTLFCCKFAFLVIYTPILGKIVLVQSLLV